jgi:hypothetical protein
MSSRSRFRPGLTHVLLAGLVLSLSALAQTAAPLPSWNDGPAKQAILSFIKDVTGKNSPKYIAPEDRIATSDRDGTLWVRGPGWT